MSGKEVSEAADKLKTIVHSEHAVIKIKHKHVNDNSKRDTVTSPYTEEKGTI